MGIGCAQYACSLLTTSVLKTGNDITSSEGTVEADAPGNSFWDDM